MGAHALGDGQRGGGAAATCSGSSQAKVAVGPTVVAGQSRTLKYSSCFEALLGSFGYAS